MSLHATGAPMARHPHPMEARPAFILVHLTMREDALFERARHRGMEGDTARALMSISRLRGTVQDTEYRRWRREMRISDAADEWEGQRYWFDVCLPTLLLEGRRLMDQWLDMADLLTPASRQPAARGEHFALHAAYHWPQPEAHGPHLFEFGSSWRFRGDLGLGRYGSL